MARVDFGEGIKYGFVILGYFIVIFIAGIILAVIGGLLSGAGGAAGGAGGGVLALIGGVIVLIGILVFYAGFFGAGYKIVADGVTRGIENADGFGGESGDRDRRSTTRSGRHASDRSSLDTNED